MHEKLKWHVGKKQIWLSKLYNVENIFRGHKVRCELILQRKVHIKMEADIFSDTTIQKTIESLTYVFISFGIVYNI